MVGRATQVLQTANAKKDRAHDVVQRILAMQQGIPDEDDDSKNDDVSESSEPQTTLRERRDGLSSQALMAFVLLRRLDWRILVIYLN